MKILYSLKAFMIKNGKIIDSKCRKICLDIKIMEKKFKANDIVGQNIIRKIVPY